MPAQAPETDKPPSDLIFEAVIRPHRSLTARGLAILIGAICTLSFATSVVFYVLGAWPVVGFTGVEVTAAVLLLRLNALAARECELSLLAPHTLRIVRTDRHGRQEERHLDPSWLRVTLEERPGRVPALLLRASGHQEEVAARLGEREKRDLSRALGDALHRWRNPRYDLPAAPEPS